MNTEISELKNKIAALEEQLQNYIPRRRVRRVYKELKKILEQDLENENKQYIDTLKVFIFNIEQKGEQIAGHEIKTAIEHLLSIIDLE